MVVNTLLTRCLKMRFCSGYLYNTTSSDPIDTFLVGDSEHFGIIGNVNNNQIITQDVQGYSIYAYENNKLNVVEHKSLY